MDFESHTEDGRWLFYKLEPSDLAVYRSNAAEAGITLLWKGGTDVHRLGAFFEKAARQLRAPKDPLFRAWVVTQSGPEALDIPKGHLAPIPGKLLSQAQFVRFECLHGQAEEGEGAESEPVFAVFANLDREASSLEDLQQSVGVYLQPEDLPALSKGIAEVVADTSSSFFPHHRVYQTESVLDRLREVGGDMRATLAL